MFCPSCGVETAAAERKFCRSCGMDLRMVVRTLTGDIQPDDVSAQLEKNPRRKMMRIGFATLWGGLMLAILLAITSEAVHDLNATLGNLISNLAPLGALVMMIGVGVMIYSRFLPKTASLALPSQDRAVLPNPQQMALPPERSRQPVSSVTEGTTKLFEEEPSVLPREIPRSE
ncbi:MAG TPA: hypothetical protein VLE20_10565 [Blastocatellia bacterium]|nr:hypothetical protein [Blastocatellia bacterium]